MGLCSEFKASCERIAIDWRRKLGNRRAFDPLPSSDLLQALEISLVASDQLTELSAEQRRNLEALSSAIVCIDPVVVLYNSSHSPARHESNMMHECAHVILKHPMIPFDPTVSYVPRNDQYEAEAVYLGGCLQIPRRGLLWAIQKGLSVERIASHFGASIEMVQYRANMTGQRKRINGIIPPRE